MDDDNDIQPLYTISHISEESQILNSIENFETSSQCEDDYSFQEQCNTEYFSSRHMYLYSMEEFGNSTVEIFKHKQKHGEIPTRRVNQNITKKCFCICMGVH